VGSGGDEHGPRAAAGLHRGADLQLRHLVAIAVSNAETRSQLNASRARVVATADETRRRLERDLHDGIQQRLVSLALQARATATAKPPPPSEVRDEPSQLADGLAAALDELREVSRGSHGALTMRVRDDGVGGADPGRGSGSIGLKDRVEALGGRITVSSPPGAGTTLDVQLPAAEDRVG
jgi:signal transduction histidine kinase